MTTQDFEKVYELYRNDALAVLVSRGYSHELAEDAVQTAATYLLASRLDKLAHITKSLFLQQCTQAASKLHEQWYGSARRTARIVGIGSLQDLADFESGARSAECISEDANNMNPQEEA